MFGSVKHLNLIVTRAPSDKILIFLLTSVAIQATYQTSAELFVPFEEEEQELPRFAYISPPQNVTSGENANLSCIVEHTGYDIIMEHDITWRQILPDNRIRMISWTDKIDRYNFQLEDDSFYITFNISISSIVEDDGGKYFCLFFSHMNNISIETQVNVQKPTRKGPNPIVFLDCIVRIPSSEYKVMGRRMNTTEFGSVPYLAMNSSNPSALMLEKITRNDVEKDECTMENVFLLMDIDIETRIAPVIHVCNFNVRNFPDFRAYLECVVECDDGTTPQVVWYKDNVRLNQKPDLTALQIRPIGPLLFFKVRLGYNDNYTMDYGYFTLRVRNEIGEKEITVGFFPTYRRWSLFWILVLGWFVIFVSFVVIRVVYDFVLK